MTPQSEKESNIKQLGRLPYGGCPKALPFCLLVTEAVPQPFRKALAFLVVLVAQRRIKFPQLILLGLGHALGHFHHHTHILVAAARPFRAGMPLSRRRNTVPLWVPSGTW